MQDIERLYLTSQNYVTIVLPQGRRTQSTMAAEQKLLSH